jgi:hypothetical protein
MNFVIRYSLFVIRCSLSVSGRPQFIIPICRPQIVIQEETIWHVAGPWFSECQCLPGISLGHSEDVVGDNTNNGSNDKTCLSF